MLTACLVATVITVATGSARGSRASRGAIQRLLDRRARAVITGDRDAFLATISNASTAFVARQKAFFDRVSTVPLGTYRLAAAWDRYGDLARPSDEARYPRADDVAIPVTEERYRIRGYDDEEAVEDQFFTFVREKDRWLIAEDTDLDDLTLYSSRHLWDFGARVVERVEQKNFLVLYHPCRGGRCPVREHDYLSLAATALDRVRNYWSLRWNKQLVFLIPDTQQELSRMIQATFSLDDFVAFAYSSVDVADGVDYTGHRIILNPEALEGRTREAVVAILAHEMLHVATRESSGPFVPIFVDEGIAEYAGYDADPSALAFFDSEAAGGVFDGRLPEDYQFTVGTGTDIYRSYQKAHSAVRFFVQRWGLKAFSRFYRTLGRVKIQPGTLEYHLSRALKRATGKDLDGFEKAWADSIG